MKYDEAVSKMSERERNIPITDLLRSVGLEHFPNNGIQREVRNAGSGDLVGYYSADKAVILYVQTRDAMAVAA